MATQETASPKGVSPRSAEDAPKVEQPAAPDPDANIEPDPQAQDVDDADSTYGGSNASTRSESLASSVLNYKYENGRRYHAYREGQYLLPNDEAEQDRLDLHHHVFRLCLDGRLFRAPITSHPQRVLDFGTGTGIWAIDFADEFPSAEILGTDLSPIQPSWVPPNCKFYVDDCEAEWVYSEEDHFDFVHARGMAGAIQDWAKLYANVAAHLKPGGWLEMQEYETWCRSDDDSIARAPHVSQWQELVNQAASQFGKEMNVAHTQKQKLIDAGFVDVQDDVYKIPVGPWPKDPKLKEIGRYQLEQVCVAIEPFCLGFLGKVLHWSEEECKALTANVIREFKDRKNHFYVNFHFVYGRKPEEG